VRPPKEPGCKTMDGEPTYYALRIRPEAHAPRWWATAAAHAAEAPPAARAILLGSRHRVEVTADEAVAALRWARKFDGWPAHGPTPVWVYPSAPAGAADGADRG
jgi:hypothetical protein